jgi:hypothetical protein
MKIMSRFSLLAVCAFAAPLACATDYYVQSIRAPILSSPSFGSSKVIEASKGEVLQELERKGGWHKVLYKNKSGWVSRLLINSKPPARRISVLEATNENLETGARKRASAFTTAAAARGFSEDRTRVSNKYKVDFAGLARMEQIKFSDEEAMAFLQEGVGK